MRVEAARQQELAAREREAEYYRTGGLVFADEARRRQLLEQADEALEVLRR